MKKALTVILAIIFLIACIPVVVAAQDEELDDSVQTGSHSMDAQIPVLGTEQKIQNIKSAILYEVSSDTLMYAWNADEQMAPASLTKILTALIAVEKADLAAKITIKENVLNSVASDAVKSDIFAGEVLSLEDLLYFMLVDSGNNAAAVIADYVAGSQELFVQEMNAYARSLGCTQTNFMNVHGLHDDNQYTTARDMGRILAAASKSEKFCEIFGTVFHTVSGNNLVTKERQLATENALLNPEKGKAFYDEDVLGSRTGVDRNGYRCVASIAEKNDLRFVVIVMGAASDLKEYSGYLETSDLINLGGSGFKSYQLVYAGQVMKQAEVENGDCYVSLGAQKSVSTVLPSGVTLDDLAIKYDNLQPVFTAPIDKGTVLSRVKYMYGSTCIAQIDLYALNSVSEKNVSVQIEQPQFKKESPWKTIIPMIIIVLSVLLALFITIRIYVFVVNRSQKAQAHRRRGDRRRSK